MLKIQDLTVEFGKLQALKKVNLEISPHQTLGVLGLSGSGKSTLIKCLCGLIKPSGGQILWNNQPVAGHVLYNFRQHLGYVPQDGGLFPHLTNSDNVLLASLYSDMSPKQKKDRLYELADLSSLPHHIFDKKPHQISGGQRQRISLMRALFQDPDLLLLDEPFSALDPIIRSELQDYVKGLMENLRKTLILVTHDIFEASYLSDMMIIMNQGHIVQEGVLQDFLSNPADDFVKNFVGVYKKQIQSGDSIC